MKQTHVTAGVEIALPIDQAFAAAGDRRRRMALLPDNFEAARLTSEHAEGIGARFEFTVTTDRGSYRSVTEVTAWTPPHAFSERTSDDVTTYDTHWSFAATDTGTRVSMRTEYTATGNPLLRLLTGRFERQALQQSLMVELLRLKQALESSPT